MTTNSSTSNIQQGGQVASAATARKTGKRPTAASLSELFSNISQQVKSVTKSNTVSFKKILEPAKTASSGSVAKVEQPQEKKATTTDHLLIAAVLPTETNKKIEIKKQAVAAAPSPFVSTVGSPETPSKGSKLPNQNVKPTIDPRSPMHGQMLGNNDSSRKLVTDGPKAKENTIPATVQKNVAVIQPSIKVNTVSSQVTKAARSSIESNAVSVQTALSSEPAVVPASESKVKTPAAKGAATATEKTRINYQTSDTESNAGNITDKHAKSVQHRPEIAYNKQIRESAASDATAAPTKIDVKAAAVSEQFSPLTVSTTGVVNANASATAASAIANAGANVHEQVASAAAVASHKIGQKIAVNLNPPELGRISIKFEKNGDEVVGRVEVERPQTKTQIDLNLSQIVQNLQDSGVPIKRLEVVMQEQLLGNQQEFADHAQPDRDGKHHFGFEKNYPDIPSAVSANEQYSYAAQSDAYFSDKSVNILV